MLADRGSNTESPEKEALVRGSDGRVSSGKLRVTGSDVITVSFPMKEDGKDGPRLVGDTTIVTIPGTGTKIEAEIVSASLMGYVEVCQFRAVRHLDGPPLQLRGERRGSSRHRPGHHVSVMVTPVEASGARAIDRGGFGHLGDISAGGCGVQFGKNDYRTLGMMSVAVLRFKLPVHGEDLEFVGERRNTRTAGTDKIWMGFGWTAATENAEPRQILSDYLKSFGS